MSTQTKEEFEPSPFNKQDNAEEATPMFFASRPGEATPTLPPSKLYWWYKVLDADHKADWALVPEPAVAAFDSNHGVVRISLPQLAAPPEATKIAVGVSIARDVHPTRKVQCRLTPREPQVPFKVFGDGGTSQPARPVEVSMTRTKVPNTPDEILWVVIRNTTNALSFNSYQTFMDRVFGSGRLRRSNFNELIRGQVEGIDLAEIAIEPFGFGGIDAYKVLRFATDVFVATHCGVFAPGDLHVDGPAEEARFHHTLGERFEKLWEKYLVPIGQVDGGYAKILPYLDSIRRKLGDIPTSRSTLGSLVDQQSGLLQDKLMHPVLLELIWSYWMEEGMLVQTFNSLTRRFQNVRSNGERDPLAQLELDPLRPVGNLLWGWLQDEQSRLSVLRRAHEYDHQYGFSLHGKAVAELRTVDRRSKFLEAFHNLLWKCMQFYKQDDDTTVIADGFPILNALKETHYLLAQGAHNQFTSLPVAAREEMMIQQWVISRPEVREFLGSRVMVPYPESWMDRVDAMKTLKGWTETSVVHFRDLATYGEQLLLSIRWGAWSTIDQPASAANWARYWRAEVQGYAHAYRAATGVDLTADVTDARQAETRFLPPSVHLRNRLLAQATPSR